MTGHLSNDFLDAKELGRYKTFVVRDASDAKYDTIDEHDNSILDSSTLLHEKYKCPNDSRNVKELTDVFKLEFGDKIRRKILIFVISFTKMRQTKVSAVSAVARS